jgi:hypothetical protein
LQILTDQEGKYILKYSRSSRQKIKKETAELNCILECWSWWYIPVIPAFGRLRQEESEFEANLGYITSLK